MQTRTEMITMGAEIRATANAADVNPAAKHVAATTETAATAAAGLRRRCKEA